MEHLFRHLGLLKHQQVHVEMSQREQVARVIGQARQRWQDTSGPSWPAR